MKYPFDSVTYMTKNKTFSVEPHFALKTDDSPLKIFAPSFSRYVMTVIVQGKAAKCNIPVSSVADMALRSRYAFDRYMEYTCKGAAQTNGNTSPAYTRRFFSGNLKGKTPADVLAENGEAGKQILNDQYMWLKNNLARFPKNQELMDAIKDAASIDVATLKGTESASPAPIPILDIGCRPLQRKTRGDGKCFCYEAHIAFDASRDYPVTVKVVNYYAPVIKRNDGTLNVKISEKDPSSEIINEFSMSAADWNHTVDMMQMSKEAYFSANFMNAYRLAEKAEIDNIQANRSQSIQTFDSGYGPAYGPQAMPQDQCFNPGYMGLRPGLRPA